MSKDYPVPAYNIMPLMFYLIVGAIVIGILAGFFELMELASTSSIWTIFGHGWRLFVGGLIAFVVWFAVAITRRYTPIEDFSEQATDRVEGPDK